MTRPSAPDACVFCGQSVGREDRVGRGASVAHPGCADRALADDEHWDQIAHQVGDRDDGPDHQPAAAPARKSGCLALGVLVIMFTAVLYAIS